MAVFFTEDEVTRLLSMDDAVEVVEDAFRQLGEGHGVNRPRARAHVPGATLHVMSAGSQAWGMLGLKAYITTPRGARFLFQLYGIDGELLAVMERWDDVAGEPFADLCEPVDLRQGILTVEAKNRGSIRMLSYGTSDLLRRLSEVFPQARITDVKIIGPRP